MPVTAITNLPDEDQPVLGNGVEDEVAVDRETAPSNYGDVRIQIRETGESSWDSNAVGFSEFIGAYDTLTIQFTGREDGEEYEVRARTETEHVDGAFTDPVAIVTKFPAASNLSVDGTTETSVSLSWTDNADNEDGFKVMRSKLYDGGWSAFDVIADLAANSETHTDDTPQPGGDYRYKIRGYTEYTSGDSSTVETSTDPLAIPRGRTGTSGWRVEVDHPDGQLLTPTIVGDPRLDPTLNDYPTVEIPVRESDTWRAQSFEGAAMRVWRDGQRQPIEELVDVRDGPGQTVLVGKGGVGLEQDHSAEFTSKEAWLAARDETQNETGYTVNADDPGEGTAFDEVMQSASTTADFNEVLNEAETLPVVVENDTTDVAQTCWTTEGENFTRTSGGGGDPDGKSSYSGGDAGRLETTGDSMEWDFTVDYTIPAENFNAKVRDDDGTSGLPAFTWYAIIDGTRYYLDSHGGGADVTLGWSSIGDGDYDLDGGYSGPDVPPGTHTLGVEIDDGVGSGYYYRADVVAPYDDRYSYFFDDDNGGSGGYLDGPEWYPNAVDVEFVPAESVYNVTAGDLTSTWDDTSNQQAVAISNDGGESYQSASNTTSISHTFAEGGASIRWRATLSRYGSRTTATPQTGFNGQSVQDFELSATLEESPVLKNQSYEGDLMEILQQIADYGGFVFEIRWSDSADGVAVEWTQPGLRTATKDPRIEDYQTTKRNNSVVTKATVKGGSQQRTGERFSANHGTAVDLAQDHLIDGREAVYDPSSGTQFTADDDYQIDTTDGTITALASGAMTDGAEYAIDYDYKARGTFTSDSHGGDRRDEITRTIPNITTDRGCEQAALRIVDEAEEPLQEVSVTLPEQPPGLSLVEALDLEGLPAGALEVWSVENQPGEVQLTMGSRKRVKESIRQIRTLSQGASERV